MKIEVIGPGGLFCKRFYRRVQEVVDENGIDAAVEHVTDLRISLKYIPRTPVLIVDGKIRHRGKLLPGKEKIAEMLGEG